MFIATADDAIEVLNRVHSADPTVLRTLIKFRVPCNAAVANDPSVQVTPDTTVGVLGVLNGIFGIDGNGRGPIAAHYDDAGDLTHFERTYG